MSNLNPFSFSEYISIIKAIKLNFQIVDYKDVDSNLESFCVIRHDVEFSLDRALEIAIIENKLKINSSFFVQINNNTYNALSSRNLRNILDIVSLGHKIGVHFTPSSSDKDLIGQEFYKYKNTIEAFLDLEIDRFSYHRPNLDLSLLKDPIKIPGIINVYDPLFFHYTQNLPSDKLNVKYISDSQHSWSYGHPMDVINEGSKKVQALFHPYCWSREGMESKENFEFLINEKVAEMVGSIKSECHHFPKENLKREIKFN